MLRILHCLTHRTPIPRIWFRYGSSPRHTLIKVVLSGSEMIPQPDFNIVGGRRRSICSCQGFQELYLETRRGKIERYVHSQSKLFGHLTVFLPSQCWCARFGELTAINNFGRRRRWARTKKNSAGWKRSNYFCLRL